MFKDWDWKTWVLVALLLVAFAGVVGSGVMLATGPETVKTTKIAP